MMHLAFDKLHRGLEAPQGPCYSNASPHGPHVFKVWHC